MDEGHECRVRLKKSSRFDFSCGRSLAGEGSYESTGEKLSLNFEWMARDGKRTTTPAPLEMGAEQSGNVMELTLPNASHVRWERKLK
jgi:hypothetical protein